MEACPTCPNRIHADTLDALAETAERSRLFRVCAPTLRKRASAVRETGCNNWKKLDENVVDISTGQVVDTRKVARCMRDRMVGYLNEVHRQAHLNGKAAESHRNVVAEGFSHLTGHPIVGDGASLPGEFREALRSIGVCEEQKALPGKR